MLALVVLLLAAAGAAIYLPPGLLFVDSGPVKADVIVLFAGGLGERPRRAAEFFKEHDSPRFIVSGLGDCAVNRRILLVPMFPPVRFRSKANRPRPGKMPTSPSKGSGRKSHSRWSLACFEKYALVIKFYSRPSSFAMARANWMHNKTEPRVNLEYLISAGC